jgi:CelD/BcsL family acetyltransferase involved in cellulose biosynthesis
VTTVRVARSFEEIEDLRPAWKLLQNDYLTSDVDFVLTYCRHTPGVVRPHVVLVEDDGEPVALAAARLEDIRLPARLGYKIVLNTPLRALTVVYGGLLGDTARIPALLDAVDRSISGERLDLVRFRMLELGSPQHEALAERAPSVRKQRFATRMPHWRAALPGSLDEFLARRSRRRRESVRRYSRRLEKTYGDEARVEVVRDTAGLDRLFADTALIHRETYQHILGVGFSDARVQRRLAELAADRGWFRGYVLYLRDEPVAFWHGNTYRGTFGVTSTGFDPAHAEDRPGTYLLMRALDHLAAEGETHAIDFGFGDADYKRHFGDAFASEQDIGIFEPRAKSLALNAVHSALGGATAGARAVAAGTGALANVRRQRREGKAGRLKSLVLGVLVALAVYTAAGLAAGPAVAMGPEHTVITELTVDGVRRPDQPLPVRRGELIDDEPADDPPVPGDVNPLPLQLAA